MSKVVCFGEMLLRLSPPGNQRFVQARSFDAVYGGAEANVAVALANMGVASACVSKLPDNPIGQGVVNELRRYGVDTSGILRGGERLGIYFLEKGASERPSVVVYDRAHSSFSGVSPEEFDWPSLLADARWFHFSGITPAVGDGPARAALDACRTARAMGITVSCDINYRRNLWPPDKAGRVMSELLGHVDVCVANEEHARLLFGVSADPADMDGGELAPTGYESVARGLAERFGLGLTALTIKRSHSAARNDIGAMAYKDGQTCFSRMHPLEIVDSIGGGDAFTAGLIFGALNGWAMRDTLEYAVSANALKQSVEGDVSLSSAPEIQGLAEGDGTVRVKR